MAFDFHHWPAGPGRHSLSESDANDDGLLLAAGSVGTGQKENVDE